MRDLAYTFVIKDYDTESHEALIFYSRKETLTIIFNNLKNMAKCIGVTNEWLTGLISFSQCPVYKAEQWFSNSELPPNWWAMTSS